MSEKASDADLVARARAGQAEAFGELYLRYFDPIFRYLRTRLPEAQDAEDMTETVFLRAYQALPSYRERGWPFSAFLYQVARNALTDHYRQQRHEAELEAVETSGTPVRALDEDLARMEQVASLQRMMAELPPDYQEVIRLRVLLSLPTETTAQWMARSEGAVRVLLHRALESLRKRMAERGAQLDD
jgi:RNA polymerase sigma-70 factor (ECF subfamily)